MSNMENINLTDVLNSIVDKESRYEVSKKII